MTTSATGEPGPESACPALTTASASCSSATASRTAAPEAARTLDQNTLSLRCWRGLFCDETEVWGGIRGISQVFKPLFF